MANELVTVHGVAVAPHTIRHAVKMLHKARSHAVEHGSASAMAALRNVTRYMRPCAAVGVAKRAIRAADAPAALPQRTLHLATVALEAIVEECDARRAAWTVELFPGVRTSLEGLTIRAVAQ